MGITCSRPLDVTILNFCFWDLIKSKAYKSFVKFEELQHHIEDVMFNISPKKIKRTTTEEVCNTVEKCVDGRYRLL